MACAGSASEEWATWRGPQETGESSAVGLVASWDVDGDNMIWRQPFTGRSTPVVFDGRVCANGRAGSDVTDMRATVACWDAGDGTLLWQHDFNVYNTTVPFTRVGWSSVTGDADTGYLYHHGVDGLLVAFDREGDIVWEWRLGEDTGRASGYGGRTQNPVIDGDQLLLSNMGANWGEFGAPRHRFWSFDKRTGEVLWVSMPGNRPWDDANTQGTPVVAEIGGRRLLVAGGADGWIYAMDVGTGAPVWEFELSKRGINVTPVVIGDTVFIAHSEENIDSSSMGRVVAIDGTGSGDITSSGEMWRANALGIGFSSPLHHEGVLYVVDNSSNLIALDAATGEQRWQVEVGTVGKSSPVYADGKIYYTEVNGRVYILSLGADGAEIIDMDEIDMPGLPAGLERHAEIYGSPAIAYGRVYISTEAGIFCIGDPSAAYSGEGVPVDYSVPAGSGEPARLQVVPAELIVNAGEEVTFEVRAFDANGRPLGARQGASWLLEGLSGTMDENGAFRPADGEGQAGKVIAELGGLTASARVRAFPPLPWETNFESGAKPSQWMGGGLYRPAELDGGYVLQKSPSPSGLHRHVIYMGPDSMTGYTVQADLMGSRERRRRPDLGLINGGYTLDLQGNYQRLEVRAWASELRLTKQFPEAAQVPFAWNEDTWYTMKLRVDVAADHTLIRGKVWERGTPEPEAWTITVQDPLRIAHGAPGIYGYAPVDIFYDNVSVMENQ
jgi:outer membrane protein assembly factor BamB